MDDETLDLFQTLVGNAVAAQPIKLCPKPLVGNDSLARKIDENIHGLLCEPELTKDQLALFSILLQARSQLQWGDA